MKSQDCGDGQNNTKIRSEFDDLIERELAEYVYKLCRINDVIQIIGESVEYYYKNIGFIQGERARLGAEILLPLILKKYKKGSASASSDSIKVITEALQYASDYRNYRDIIFHSYNDNDSVSWQKIGNKFKIINHDLSVYRQLLAEMHSSIFSSKNMSKKIYSDNDKTIEELLKGTKNFDYENKNVVKASNYILKELQIKLDSFFSYIEPDSEISFGQYNYSDFFKVYHMMMFYALYERHNSRANNLPGVITYTEEELIYAAEQNIQIEKSKCKKILLDIASASRSTFVYLKTDSIYYLFPTAFSLLDGISSILKQYAQLDSDAFSERFAGLIGDGLVNEIKSEFSCCRNFRTLTDLKLDKYDPSLPDIDVMAISYEPSLGFHFFIAEVKNNLPATWAKEYLKASGSKGFISKALSQVDKVNKFLNSEDGQRLLFETAIKEFSHLDMQKLFPTGFTVTVNQLIITSQNMGMFFSDKHTTIIEGEMLRHIIRASDGDTNYILFHLKNFDKILDECLELLELQTKIGKFEVTYNSFKMKQIFDLSENKYLSDGTFEELERSSIETGYRFIDQLISDNGNNQKYDLDI
ncbi:hypothetical protein [Sulfurimonas sp.]|uniref:hypothetical protein n=1 Tax=Sulfurimonas sp. TaxID=2022749 RepID=UPI00286DC7F4|nr:hypothetical protein [Sulfurimonas sp.]